MQEGDFIDSIIEDPDDDGPRLMMADWLDEWGNPDRAEFIRLQIELARAKAQGLMEEPDEWLLQLQQRERELRYAEEWRWGELVRRGEFGLERGFVESLRLSGKDFLERGDEILENTPARSLTLCELSQKDLEKILESPHIGKIRRLTIKMIMGDSLVRTLATCPALANLEHLDLRYNTMNDEHMETLTDSLYLKRLRSLKLDISDCTAKGLLCFYASSHFSHLRSLSLAHRQIPWREHGAAEVALLAYSPQLKNLEQLELVGWGLGTAGCRTLACSPTLSNLRHLALIWNDVGEGAEAIVNSPNLPRLTALNLSDSHISYQGWHGLTEAPGLARIRSLHLNRTDMGNDDLSYLLYSSTSQLGPLRSLQLADNRLSDAAADHIADCAKLSELRQLRLESNRITEKGVHSLLASPHLTRLTDIGLTTHEMHTATEERLRRRFPFGTFGLGYGRGE